MGCANTSQKVQLNQDDLESILAIYPGKWSQAQVLRWLALTHDGDLMDLIEPFRKHQISGVSLVKLTKQMLKDELDVKQFGLRDGFISARDKVLEGFPDKGTDSNAVVDNGGNINGEAHKPAPAQQQPPKPRQSTTTLSDKSDITAAPVDNGHGAAAGIDPTLPTKGEESMLSNATNTQKNGVVQNAAAFLDDTATNYTNQTASNNGGYETIDLFSPGFSNMPTNSFQQQDEMAQEEDQYAKIDYADLNNPDPPLSTRVQSMQRFESNPSGMPATSALPFSFHTQSMYSPPSLAANGAAPSTHMSPNFHPLNGGPALPATGHDTHRRDQTGSNYDDLPLEFINDFSGPNGNSMNGVTSSNHGSIQPPRTTTMMDGGGYQEIVFGADASADVDNISSQPSNGGDSVAFATAQGPLYIGQIIQFEDAHTSQWLEAEVEHVDRYRGSARVKCVKAPRQTVMVALHKIRVLSPPTDALSQMQLQSASVAQIQVDKKAMSVGPGGVGPGPAAALPYASPLNEMSAPQKKIHEFARELWKTLNRIEVKTITDDNNEPLRGFSGKELIRHIRSSLKEHVRDDLVVAMCGDLVQYQYIRLIASVDHNTTQNAAAADKQPQAFTDSDKFLYQFENEKHREFIKDDQPDRRAWTRGTKVQIYSATLGGWQQGTVVEVNNDTLTITYGRSNQQMRKTLDRYQDDLVKSTTLFVEQRKQWQTDSEIEVYSHGQHIWCLGRIEEVLPAKEQQPVDIFRVFYTNNDDKDFSKYVDRWSPDLRDVQQLSPKLAKYKKGTKVKVWSNSKQNWIGGVVIDVVPTYEVVNVRYGDHEKLVPVASEDIKLFDDDDDDNDHTPMN